MFLFWLVGFLGVLLGFALGVFVMLLLARNRAVRHPRKLVEGFDVARPTHSPKIRLPVKGNSGRVFIEFICDMGSTYSQITAQQIADSKIVTVPTKVQKPQSIRLSNGDVLPTTNCRWEALKVKIGRHWYQLPFLIVDVGHTILGRVPTVAEFEVSLSSGRVEFRYSDRHFYRKIRDSLKGTEQAM